MEPGPSTQSPPARNVPRGTPKVPIPPTVFRFQSAAKNGKNEAMTGQNQRPRFQNGNGIPPIRRPAAFTNPANFQNRAPQKRPAAVQKEVQQPVPPPVSSPNQNHEFHQYSVPSTSSAPSTSYSQPEITQEPVYTMAEIENPSNLPNNHMNSAKEEPIPQRKEQNGAFIECKTQGGQIQEVCEEELPKTIELPNECKLFQYSWIVNGVPRTLLVPMPMNATEDDVRAMLPQTLDFDQMMVESDRSRGELPTLAYPDGSAPSIQPREQEHKPILVNPKQYGRIMRRRQMRQSLELSGRLPLQRQKYLHESRHLHALKRKRGIDGRFDTKLTAETTPTSEPCTASETKRYVAQTMPRTVTTYAEIRPAHDMGPSTSSDTSSYHHHTQIYAQNLHLHQEPITSYQQYQQHVRYPEPIDNHEEQPAPMLEEQQQQQKFTNL